MSSDFIRQILMCISGMGTWHELPEGLNFWHDIYFALSQEDACPPLPATLDVVAWTKLFREKKICEDWLEKLFVLVDELKTAGDAWWFWVDHGWAAWRVYIRKLGSLYRTYHNDMSMSMSMREVLETLLQEPDDV